MGKLIPKPNQEGILPTIIMDQIAKSVDYLLSPWKIKPVR
jgi:hypothetical protein